MSTNCGAKLHHIFLTTKFLCHFLLCRASKSMFDRRLCRMPTALNPIRALGSVQFLCIVEHIYGLTLECVVGYIERNKTGKMPTNKRKTERKKRAQPKTFDKLPDA